MIFKKLFARKTDVSQTLYDAIVAAARQPYFYQQWAVPDTVDGRFDMIVLHVHMAMQRLAGQGRKAETLRQDLVDTFFRDMDRSLREMGVGDLSVGKKVRKMSESFYGRVLAYNKAGANADEFADALKRNVYVENDSTHALDFANWVVAAQHGLSEIPLDEILQGQINFSAVEKAL